MQNFWSWKTLAIILLIAGVLITAWVLIFGGYLNGSLSIPDADKAKEIHPFITGLVVPLLTLGTTLLVFENLRNTSLQNFSNNFFKLIDQHHKLVDNINTVVEPISSEDKPSKGRNFFDDLCERIANDYYVFSELSYEEKNEVYEIDEILRQKAVGKTGKELLLIIYDFYFHLHQSDIGHYFRNLYHIVKYAENCPFRMSIQVQHTKILRAQLSNYEILLLAYNGLHPFGAKFYRLMEKYELLKNLNTEKGVPDDRIHRIVDLEIIKEAYPHFKKFLSAEIIED